MMKLMNTYFLAFWFVALLVPLCLADEADEKAALRKERQRLRELIMEVQREVEAAHAEDAERDDDEAENTWVYEHEEGGEEALHEEIEHAEELAEEIAERIEEQAEAFGEHLEVHFEEAAERFESWAEEHSERWEAWAEEYGRTWEAWAEDQEQLWEDWSDEYSQRWEHWAEQLETEGFDQEELSKLLEHNLEMLGRMPLSEVYEQLLEAPEHVKQMPLDSLQDLELIVRESVEQAMQGLEEGIAESDLEGLSSSLDQLREAMQIKNKKLEDATVQQLHEATAVLEAARARSHELGERSRRDAQRAREAAEEVQRAAQLQELQMVQEQAERARSQSALIRELLAEVEQGRSGKEARKLIAELSEERAEIDDRDAEMAELREEIAALRAEVKALKKAKAKKR